MSDNYTSIEARELAGRIKTVVLQQGELHDNGMWFTFDESNPAVVEVEPENYSHAHRMPVSYYLDALKDADAATHCGTTACVAGWASIFSAPPGSYVSDSRVFFPDGGSREADNIGQDVLGLDSEESAWLFSAARSRSEVIEGLTQIEESGCISDELLYEAYEDDDEDDEA